MDWEIHAVRFADKSIRTKKLCGFSYQAQCEAKKQTLFWAI